MSKRFDRQKWNDILRLLKKGTKHLFLHNGWVKLLAVLISVALWAGLISQDPSVIRNKTFQNVYIEVEGLEDLQKKGRIVTSDLDALLSDVRVTAAVPQLQYEDAEASKYNLRIDLSGIRNTGEQEVRIMSDNDAKYGEVLNINPSTINIMVEEYITYQTVPITIKKEGEVPEGWYITPLTVEPKTVSVSGPISLIKELSRGKVMLDLTAQKWEEGTFRAIGEIKLQNLKGEEINNPLLTISSGGNDNDIVILEAKMLRTRNIPLKDLVQIKGEPAEGYQIVGEPVFSTEYITVIGSESTLIKDFDEDQDKLPDKILESKTVDITGLTETTKFDIDLKLGTFDDTKAVQNEVVQPGVSKEIERTVTVTVNIEPISNADASETEEPAPTEPPVTEP